jgi:hypothetical protein
MAHFAEIGEDNIVLRVIVVSNDDCKDAEGNESEAVGAEFCRNLLGGTWKQTSYNGTIRFRYAGSGYTYNSVLNAFIAPKPFASWLLNETTTEWEAPVARPTDGMHSWNEENQFWDRINVADEWSPDAS